MKGSIRQRSTGSWELTIEAGRDTRGKRQRRYVTVRGTKAQAQRRLRELLSAVDQGAGIPARKTTLRAWLDRWMREVITPHRRQRTKEHYQHIIEHHINPAIGHIDITRLGPSHVQALESPLPLHTFRFSDRRGPPPPVHHRRFYSRPHPTGSSLFH